MAKFDNGDRIQVRDNGLTGTIWAVVRDYSDGGVTEEYEVKWDHFPNTTSNYMASDTDDLWDLIGQIKGDQEAKDVKLPVSEESYQYWYGIPQDKVKFPKECEHKWVEVGFTFTKTVCYHCDKEKT